MSTGGGVVSANGGSMSTGGGASTGGGGVSTGGGGAVSTGGGGVSAGGGGASTGGGGASTGGGASSGGGGCVPYVTLSASDQALETALVSRDTLAFVYLATDGGVVYGECASGCTTQAPAFNTAMLPLPPATHIALAERAAGGVAAAAVVASGNGPHELRYLECASSCAGPNPTGWTQVTLDPNAADVRASIASIEEMTAVAYGSNGGLGYAECAIGCDSLASWNTVAVAPTKPTKNTGVGLQAPGVSVYRYAASDTGTVYACSGPCTAATDWTSLGAPASSLNVSMAFVANPALRIAGTHGSPNIHFAQCLTTPCTMSMDWSPGQSVSVMSTVSSMDVTADGQISILYSNSTTQQLTALLIDGNNMATMSPFTACGQTLTGQNGALSYGGVDAGAYVLFGAAGGPGVLLHAP